MGGFIVPAAKSSVLAARRADFVPNSVPNRKILCNFSGYFPGFVKKKIPKSHRYNDDFVECICLTYKKDVRRTQFSPLVRSKSASYRYIETELAKAKEQAENLAKEWVVHKAVWGTYTVTQSSHGAAA